MQTALIRINTESFISVKWWRDQLRLPCCVGHSCAAVALYHEFVRLTVILSQNKDGYLNWPEFMSRQKQHQSSK